MGTIVTMATPYTVSQEPVLFCRRLVLLPYVGAATTCCCHVFEKRREYCRTPALSVISPCWMAKKSTLLLAFVAVLYDDTVTQWCLC